MKHIVIFIAREAVKIFHFNFTGNSAFAKWLKEDKVRVLEWPPQNPDLNPTENLQEVMKKYL